MSETPKATAIKVYRCSKCSHTTRSVGGVIKHVSKTCVGGRILTDYITGTLYSGECGDKSLSAASASTLSERHATTFKMK